MPSLRLRSQSLNFDVIFDFLPSGRLMLIDGKLTPDGNFLVYAQFLDQNLQTLPFHIGEAQVAGQVINLREYIAPDGDNFKYRMFVAELPSEIELKDLSFFISY